MKSKTKQNKQTNVTELRIPHISLCNKDTCIKKENTSIKSGYWFKLHLSYNHIKYIFETALFHKRGIHL